MKNNFGENIPQQGSKNEENKNVRTDVRTIHYNVIKRF